MQNLAWITDIFTILALCGIGWLGLALPRAIPVKIRDSEGRGLVGRVLKIRGFQAKRLGLLNTPQLGVGDGLLLTAVSSIHTLGMMYAIDLVFLDSSGRVLGLRQGVEPGQKRIKGPKGTRTTLELGHGTLDLWQLGPGVQLIFEPELSGA